MLSKTSEREYEKKMKKRSYKSEKIVIVCGQNTRMS